MFNVNIEINITIIKIQANIEKYVSIADHRGDLLSRK